MTSPSVSIQQTTLTIRGMTCMGCAATIERVIGALPGVQTVQVDLADKQAQVSYDSTVVDIPELAEAVTKAGYSVEGSSQTFHPPSASSGVAHPWQRALSFSACWGWPD